MSTEYSYNNIIEKNEPKGKHDLDSLILTVPDAAAALAADATLMAPKITTCWRWADVADRGNEVSDNDVVVVNNLLLPSECASIISTCERLGFTFWADASAEVKDEDPEAASSSSDAHQHTDAFRSAFTVEVHLEEFAARLWARLQPVALSQIGSKSFYPTMPNADRSFERDLEGLWEPVGVCDNVLFARYREGGHFAPHVDGSNIIDLNTRTMFTVLVYLNTCVSGGETLILAGEQCDALQQDEATGRFHSKPSTRIGAVAPTEGSASIFYYDVLHEGSPVAGGGNHEKYIIRADVLYRRNPPILTAPRDLDAFRFYQEARVLEANGNALEAVKKFQAVRKLSPGVADLYQL
ncbi:2OG-Fe(II) oxygenase, putative [Bodo saltans]|uniref:2OG-Fe(II) oxygenase, putative n=1 Tax=Bodo saltans TaxID=75058 RepID=A0A0S4JJ67_BODSA|nr:2OG-Fe(II) oxygenase, putative [Bodo saltans]|eukprot:CUG91575.1 2OG-Fe(II) oxygenase, putative [Bodo saltans]